MSYKIYYGRASFKNIKKLESKEYNYIFNTKTGFFARWGKTKEDDPQFCPFGPEIADIEISTSCSRGCKWCYKNNVAAGDNMTVETFETIISKFPNVLCQVALGVGDVDANPDLIPILKSCHRHLVVPNITINGSRLTSEMASKLAANCGAIAVSHYGDECFDAIKMLAKEGAKQLNIHQLLSAETIGECVKIVKMSAEKDERMKNVNAIIFLILKKKGRGTGLNRVSDADFKNLLDTALANNVRIGFDSCASGRMLSLVHPTLARVFDASVEPCESSCFSIYVNVDGKVFPCSFVEGIEQPVDLVNAKDFVKDVWNSPQLTSFRERLLANDRRCPAYEV